MKGLLKRETVISLAFATAALSLTPFLLLIRFFFEYHKLPFYARWSVCWLTKVEGFDAAHKRRGLLAVAAKDQHYLGVGRCEPRTVRTVAFSYSSYRLSALRNRATRCRALVLMHYNANKPI